MKKGYAFLGFFLTYLLSCAHVSMAPVIARDTTNLVPRARAHLRSAGSKSLVLTKRNAASGNEIVILPAKKETKLT